ncbi:unnamed protein product [Adineta steineri]|uniref:Uncharacterized protein n=1 Tax=Adineta steineri TaxID=433720 RepID=A0A814JNU3_9BILA|nr:unnamed protein product [Adineta steineri]CAF1102964.1 unnamed protein product [Adineta steineri]
MFKNLKVILSLANTDTVADFDNSTEEHVNIQRDLDTKLKKLEGQKFPQGFSKPTYVLKAVDANEHSQWETQLQQESKENTGKRIILIPYYLGNSHWVGIIIQFKGTHAIQEIEFIDPVSNSSFVHENIQQKFNDLYPRVTLPSKTLQTHNDPTQSNRLTIENLLKRVEELQLMDVQTEIIDNQKTYTSLSEKIKVNGLNHIHPYEVKNTDLQKITTSPFARSETRYITPVRVNPGDVSGYTGDGFVLCDSPGFEDTNGAEVDIANGVGITKAIKGCKSVKLVILISAMSIGDRQGGVKNLARTLIGLIPGIKDHIRAVAYIFTKFSLEEKDTIHHLLKDAEQRMDEADNIVEKIVRYLRDAKLDAEDLLKIVFQRDGKVNYDKLTKCLLNLKNAEWIEKYRSGEYSYIIKDVEERLIEHITEMKVTVMQVPLNLDNYDKIDSVHKIVSDIKEMKPLEKFLPDINQHIVDVNSWFEKEINGVCIIIKASFNTEEWKKEEEKNLDFKKVEKALQYFDACKRNCISLHNDFLCVPSDLEGFVKYHSDFVQKEMESCFENMRNFQIEGKENTEQCQKERRENLFEKARILSKRLIEVSEIKTEYCRIFACYTNQRILEQWEQRLNDYHSELTNEIEMLSATNQNLTLNNKLLTVNALRALDVPPGKTKFTNLYYLYQNKILVTTNDAVGKVLDAIKTYDYARVARGMGSLKIAGNGGEYFF